MMIFYVYVDLDGGKDVCVWILLTLAQFMITIRQNTMITMMTMMTLVSGTQLCGEWARSVGEKAFHLAPSTSFL